MARTQATLFWLPEAAHAPQEFDIDQLPRLGWIQITDVGEENIYFTLEDGSKGFCKVLA